MRTINTDKLASMKTAGELLSEKYGEPGSESRERFHDQACNCYYGEILKNRRKELRMTQQQLAEKIGAPRSYIARIENGQSDIQLSNFIRIANALRIDFTPVYR